MAVDTALRGSVPGLAGPVKCVHSCHGWLLVTGDGHRGLQRMPQSRSTPPPPALAGTVLHRRTAPIPRKGRQQAWRFVLP